MAAETVPTTTPPQGSLDTRSPGSYVLGDDGLARWSEVHRDAWIGFLETHKRLTRVLDAELDAEHGLTISALEALGRLAAAPEHKLGLSALASACGLSLSRISRIIDALESRQLVERRAVACDARAVEAQLTAGGLELARRAQCSHFAAVQRMFFEQLSEGEVAELAAIFSRFAPQAAEACTEHAPEAQPVPEA
jgi:DNA-binding MarR family transcriptional regulator